MEQLPRTISYEQLQSIAGVAPSTEWLNACRSYLSSVNDDTPDAVLQQILHSDLRDVIRSSAASSASASASASSPSILLRRALEESCESSHRHSQLAADIRLLVQMEELLDVSLNAEHRLSLGPASSHAPTALGNQSKRMLKMYLSDGHLPHVNLVAMELTPLQNISVNSHAGLKLLLHGPIEIRLGILLLHEGNTTVLGGSVQHLVDIQTKAQTQAQRMAGVGIDPTIKALIWNPDSGLDENDEGEGESGDVVQQRVVLATGTMFARPMPPTSTQPTSSMPPPQPVITSARPAIIKPGVSSKVPPATTNPYSNHRSATVNTNATKPLHSNPYESKGTTTIRNNSRAFAAQTASQSSDEYVVDLTQEYSDNNERGAATQSIASPAGCHLIRSFRDLRLLLELARTDRALYEANQHNIFIVEAKMKGTHKYFNIEKNHARKNKLDEKYKYVMKATFAATENDNDTITVSVANSLMQPYFELGPTDMRKLSRVNKAEADRLVHTGGLSVKQVLTGLATWEMKMTMTSDEFFDIIPFPILDGEDAILELLQKRS